MPPLLRYRAGWTEQDYRAWVRQQWWENWTPQGYERPLDLWWRKFGGRAVLCRLTLWWARSLHTPVPYLFQPGYGVRAEWWYQSMRIRQRCERALVMSVCCVRHRHLARMGNVLTRRGRAGLSRHPFRVMVWAASARAWCAKRQRLGSCWNRLVRVRPL